MSDHYKSANTTEQAFYEMVEKVMAYLGPKYQFSFHSAEDLTQEAHIIALTFLRGGKYDGKRPLENILFVHLNNRLRNFQRDNTARCEKPCVGCSSFDKKFKRSNSGCLSFDEKDNCELYRIWKIKNDSKQSINSPQSIFDPGVEDQVFYTDELTERDDLIDIIDYKLSANLRSHFLRMVAGVSVPTTVKEEVRGAVKKIIIEDGRFESLEDFLNG
jgi:hypothetical protein